MFWMRLEGRMRTVDLARAVGLSAQQVRNYEAWGFLPPVKRSESGYRLYTKRHLEALRTVRTMIFAGYGWQQALEVMRAVHGGDLDTALARVDSQHAELDRRRRQVEHTLEAIRMQMAGSAAWTAVPRAGGLRVGEAAKAVGVRPSAMRFWEQQGLLQPGRDERSGYRLYDQRQMRRLEVVVLLRGLNYGFDAIRSVLDELAAGKPESTLRAVEKRRHEIASASRTCANATAALWSYSGDMH
jgi:DNA-binding transcriptional MerR regulator